MTEVWDAHVRLGADELRIGRLPLIMGIVNATPDSFSDAGLYPTFEARIQHAAALVDAGADIIDVGGQSGITGVPEISADEEIERVVPTIEYIARELGALVSVDTYKPDVARAAIEAGARIVNDVSGMRYPSIADVCAAGHAGLVIMHNRSAPKERLTDSGLYGDGGPLPDVLRFLRKRILQAVSRGMPREALIVDPGLDFSKTPAQTVHVLRNLDLLRDLDRPLLLAISRKDFIGAITRRPPDQRLAGTLAALEHIAGRVPAIVRVHDVAATSDFLKVLGALRGDADLEEEARLPPELRTRSHDEETSSA
jgi:dihydropteroate synthase